MPEKTYQKANDDMELVCIRNAERAEYDFPHQLEHPLQLVFIIHAPGIEQRAGIAHNRRQEHFLPAIFVHHFFREVRVLPNSPCTLDALWFSLLFAVVVFIVGIINSLLLIAVIEPISRLDGVLMPSCFVVIVINL